MTASNLATILGVTRLDLKMATSIYGALLTKSIIQNEFILVSLDDINDMLDPHDAQYDHKYHPHKHSAHLRAQHHPLIMRSGNIYVSLALSFLSRT
jgi:hypothetical protein